MADQIYIGSQVILTITFTSRATGQLVDPTVATCKVRKPDGTSTTPATTRVSQGIYTALFIPDQSGEHWYNGVGTGAAIGVAERAFVVEPQHVP